MLSDARSITLQSTLPTVLGRTIASTRYGCFEGALPGVSQMPAKAL
jgi:hypothetical protein